VPTSVLLAVLAAAALLALAPALVRRYDATERLVAERALSTARVLTRRRRRRTVPGRRPVNPPRVLVVTLRAAAPAERPDARPDDASRRAEATRLGDASLRRGDAGGWGDASSRRGDASSRWGDAGRRATAARRTTAVRRGGAARRTPARRRSRHTPAVYRRRRVLAALVLLNGVELLGVLAVGPGFWVSVAVTGTLLAAYLVHLRNMALAERRRRRVEAREAAWLAARQAEVRRTQERRSAARREAQRRLAAQREAVRRAIAGQDRSEAARLQPYSIRYTGDHRARDSRAAGF
jgi:hypothetical protein